MHGGIFRHRQPKGPAPATARPKHHRTTPRLYVRRGKARNFSGGKYPTRQLSLQPVAAGAGTEAMKCLKHPGAKGPSSGSASKQAVMRMNIEKVPKPSDADADPAQTWGRLPSGTKRAKHARSESAGALVTACWQREFCGNTGDPARSRRRRQRTAREGVGAAGREVGEVRSTGEAG